MPFPYTEYGMTWPVSKYVDKIDDLSYRIKKRPPIEVPIETCLLEHDPEYNIKSKYFNQIKEYVEKLNSTEEYNEKKTEEEFEDIIFKKLIKKFEIYFDDEFTGDILLKDFIKIILDIKRDNVLKTLKDLNEYYRKYHEEIIVILWKIFEIHEASKIIGTIPLLFFPPTIEAENHAQRTIFQIKLELNKLVWYHNDCKALIIVINKKLDERELENKT